MVVVTVVVTGTVVTGLVVVTVVVTGTVVTGTVVSGTVTTGTVVSGTAVTTGACLSVIIAYPVTELSVYSNGLLARRTNGFAASNSILYSKSGFTSDGNINNNVASLPVPLKSLEPLSRRIFFFFTPTLIGAPISLNESPSRNNPINFNSES